MIKKLVLAASVLGAALGTFALAGPAQAVVVNIDPGNIGESFTNRSFAFTELDGQALDGSAVTLDFVFAPEQLQVVSAGNFSFAVSFQIPSLLTFVPPTPDGFLSDENGNSLAGGPGGSVGQTLGAPPNRITYTLTFLNLQPLSFQGIRFSLTLPTFGAAQVSDARLDISSGAGASLTVGAQQPQQLPEPASIALFGFGLLGLGFAAKRVRRKTS